MTQNHQQDSSIKQSTSPHESSNAESVHRPNGCAYKPCSIPFPFQRASSHRIEFPHGSLKRRLACAQHVEARVMRQMALGEDRRADGRACGQVRPISSRAGLLPSTHGSALFTRGETQTISVVTLGALRTPVIAPCLLQTPCLNHLAQPSGCCTTFSFWGELFCMWGP